jgi:hypothetical protein
VNVHAFLMIVLRLLTVNVDVWIWMCVRALACSCVSIVELIFEIFAVFARVFVPCLRAYRALCFWN